MDTFSTKISRWAGAALAWVALTWPGRVVGVAGLILVVIALAFSSAKIRSVVAGFTGLDNRPGHVLTVAELRDSLGEQPNIIIINTDDQRWDEVEYMPTLQEELIQQGVTFENSFVTTPICVPSRVSLLTGQYASNHGLFGSADSDIPYFDDSRCMALWFQAAGYETALFGKYLNSYGVYPPADYIPPGWDHFHPLVNMENKETRYYYDYSLLGGDGDEVLHGDSEADYSTDVLSGMIEEFIQAAEGGQPFLVYFAPFAPHAPQIPAPRHAGTLAGLSAPRPPSYGVRTDDWWEPVEDLDLDRVFTDRAETLLAVDDSLAIMLAALEKTGQLENTVIIYTSDNGYLLGEHSLVSKNYIYQETYHVPLIIRIPGIESRRETGFSLSIDIAPTLAELAGLQVPASVDGASLLPLLLDAGTNWRENVLLEINKPYEPYGAGVRSEFWYYMEYVTGERWLFDLQADPYEMNNLASLEEYAAIERDMAARRKTLLAAIGPAEIVPTMTLISGWVAQPAGYEFDSIGIYVQAAGQFFLRNLNSKGQPEVRFTFGAVTGRQLPLAGDWDGDGIDTVGVFFPETGEYKLPNYNASVWPEYEIELDWSEPDWLPIAGDWDGNGVDEVGLYDPNTYTWHLRNSLSSGPADLIFSFGAPGCLPISGDWEGVGRDTAACYFPAEGIFWLAEDNLEDTPCQQVFLWKDGLPMSGDWDGDGIDSIGLYVPEIERYKLLVNLRGEREVLNFPFIIRAGALYPLAGNWDGK